MRPVSQEDRIRAFADRPVPPGISYVATGSSNSRPTHPTCNMCTSSGANERGDYEACPECNGWGLIKGRTNRGGDYDRRKAQTGGVQEP